MGAEAVMRGLKSPMHASYWGSSSNFRAWQTSRNFLKALGQLLLQSCFAVTSIFVLHTLKPLSGPCTVQQIHTIATVLCKAL